METVDLYNRNTDRRVLQQRWMKPGDITTLKDIKERNMATRPTSRFIQDYNVITINSLSLGYQFRPDLLKKFGLSMLRAQLSTNNLATISTVQTGERTELSLCKGIRFLFNCGTLNRNIMRKLSTILYVSLAVALCCTGCKKWLDVQPKNNLSDDKLFAAADGYRIALNGVYQQLSSQQLYGRTLSWGLASAIAQEYDRNTVDGDTYQMMGYSWENENVKGVIGSLWSTAYNCDRQLQQDHS